MININRQASYLFLAGLGTFLIGNLANALAPLIVSAVIDELNISEVRAGFLISAEFTGIAITAIIFGPFIDRLPKRKLATLGCLLAACWHGLSTQIESYQLLLAVRFLAGLSAGAALAVGGAAIAASPTPDRMFALVKTFNALVMGAMVWGAGYAVKFYGMKGGFSLLAALCILLLPLLQFLTNDTATTHKESEQSGLPHFNLGCIGLAGMLTWVVASGIAWSYLGLIGERAGLSVERVSAVIGMGYMLGVAGGFLAAAISLKFGRSLPLSLGILVNGGTWLIICITTNPLIFTVSLFTNTLSYFFIVPYLLGTLAALDVKGRWASMASTSYLGALAVSPIIGGVVMDIWNVEAVGIVVLLFETIALACMLYVIKQITPGHSLGGAEILQPEKAKEGLS